jgi:ASC-1-like (ASCH) protein
MREQPLLAPFLDGGATPVGIHLAILNEPYLTRIIEGQKTVESRFSVHRQPPFGRVQEGDVVLLKKTSGPVIASCVVDYVWDYELQPGQLDEIRLKFARVLCADDPEFWNERAEKNYATLMRVTKVTELNPIYCDKRDRRGWVVIRSRAELPFNEFV